MSLLLTDCDSCVRIPLQADNKFAAEIIAKKQYVFHVDDVLAVGTEKTVRVELLFKFVYEGENETYIEASVENSSSILYDKEIRNKPRTRRTKRNV